MIERRDLMRGLAIGLAISASQTVAACSYAEYDDDDWGGRLSDFLKTGDLKALEGFFQEESTLVAFDTSMLAASEEMYFKGQVAVGQALAAFRDSQLKTSDKMTARSLIKADLVGSLQQGRMNKIELTFADDEESVTSCGPTRNERSVDLYYEAGIHDSGEDWVKWSLQRIALMPHLETKKFGV